MPTFIKTYITMHRSINSSTFKKKFVKFNTRPIASVQVKSLIFISKWNLGEYFKTKPNQNLL